MERPARCRILNASPIAELRGRRDQLLLRPFRSPVSHRTGTESARMGGLETALDRMEPAL